MMMMMMMIIVNIIFRLQQSVLATHRPGYYSGMYSMNEARLDKLTLAF